ncbi:hypothetical protein INT48_000416 [Thamnidium elegans]|uniref:Uncharacterized protein n=1 Tax=Thamnidium elegans TaxID=101142 RepID=A0A8H7SLH0_9FUNG|nr:hypothetical protein INT48_000416 [Thamnidium elegans]
MAVSRSTKPKLQYLRGNTVLSSSQRTMFEISDGLLTNAVKDWSDTIHTKTGSSDNANDRRLFTHCSNLITFYDNPLVKKRIPKYYARKEIACGLKYNQAMLNEQSKSNAVVLSMEASMNMEDEANQRISSISNKRKYSQEGNTSDDEEQDNELDSHKDSYEIVDKHPKASHNYNHFINDEKERWKLEDVTDRWLIFCLKIQRPSPRMISLVLKLKTLKKSRTPDNNDKIKINLELQLILNQLVLLNIKDPIVYGLLIEGYECTLYEMKLEREAEYISRVVESFYMPRDMNDIALLPRITSIFLTIKDKIDMTIKSINERQRGKSILKPFIRNGMGMPRPIKDPLSFSLDFNVEDYLPPL